MKLIGVSGKARAGKDLFVSKLQGVIPDIHHRKFAGPLKSMCRDHFGLTLDQTDGPMKSITDLRYNMTPRQIMIDTGRFYRSIHPDYWIHRLEREVLQIPQAHLATVAISDVRFPNEALWVKRHGGFLVRLDRPEQLRGGNIDDISETALDDWKDWDFYVSEADNVDEADMKRQAAMFIINVLERDTWVRE